ncbi:tetratricopeptide repeat protein [Sphingorhabdus sp. 109]|jgi:tetratricopeptide (TPR) repeat protein|uniref:tetratricopeptide repeat protein n=1 Tax=Sphingorhabdus sp. 109 TaxID=2653173 RepID=UPI0012EFC8D0|nr:tetratricopeptide repeat protein [Sphingorhabdus sp. 109]VWX59158.1 Tetratricopeptide repeat protein [Sphingorhabdus sp. 109]
MISSLVLPLLLQSATPYGSPIDPLMRPSEPRTEAPAGQLPLAPKSPADIRFNQCIDQAAEDPDNGLLAANGWQIEGGGYLARNCLGFAYAELEQWPKAVSAFVLAAEGAKTAGDDRAAIFWSQAGNAAFVAGDNAAALKYLGSALEQDQLDALLKGEVHLDMARIYVAMNQYDAAKQQFVLVHDLVPEDPLGWLLSATLARRMGDLALAKADIAVAAGLAVTDPAIALEAGNIAYEAGDVVNAESNWEQAVKFGPDSPSAKTAVRYLEQLRASATE